MPDSICLTNVQNRMIIIHFNTGMSSADELEGPNAYEHLLNLADALG